MRARRPGDIDRVFSGVDVRESLGTDYRYRAVVKRAHLAAVMAHLVETISYPNFKSRARDRGLHDAYLNVWRDMAPLQPGGPYAMS